MKSENKFKYPTMSGPAVYRIRVRGHLDPTLSERVEGMQIENVLRGDGTTEGVLEGRLLDQSALAGVLNTLYELHLPVIAAICLAGSDETPDP